MSLPRDDDGYSSDDQEGRTISGRPGRRSKAGRLPGDISKSELQEHFHLSIDFAANALKVGLTTLKKLCRQFKIKRWPFRKVQQVQRLAQLSNASTADQLQFYELLLDLDVPPESRLWGHLGEDAQRNIVHALRTVDWTAVRALITRPQAPLLGGASSPSPDVIPGTYQDEHPGPLGVPGRAAPGAAHPGRGVHSPGGSGASSGSDNGGGYAAGGGEAAPGVAAVLAAAACGQREMLLERLGQEQRAHQDVARALHAVGAGGGGAIDQTAAALLAQLYGGPRHALPQPTAAAQAQQLSAQVWHAWQQQQQQQQQQGAAGVDQLAWLTHVAGQQQEAARALVASHQQRQRQHDVTSLLTALQQQQQQRGGVGRGGSSHLEEEVEEEDCDGRGNEEPSPAVGHGPDPSARGVGRREEEEEEVRRSQPATAEQEGGETAEARPGQGQPVAGQGSARGATPVPPPASSGAPQAVGGGAKLGLAFALGPSQQRHPSPAGAFDQASALWASSSRQGGNAWLPAAMEGGGGGGVERRKLGLTHQHSAGSGRGSGGGPLQRAWTDPYSAAAKQHHAQQLAQQQHAHQQQRTHQQQHAHQQLQAALNPFAAAAAHRSSAAPQTSAMPLPAGLGDALGVLAASSDPMQQQQLWRSLSEVPGAAQLLERLSTSSGHSGLSSLQNGSLGAGSSAGGLGTRSASGIGSPRSAFGGFGPGSGGGGLGARNSSQAGPPPGGAGVLAVGGTPNGSGEYLRNASVTSMGSTISHMRKQLDRALLAEWAPWAGLTDAPAAKPGAGSGPGPSQQHPAAAAAAAVASEAGAGAKMDMSQYLQLAALLAHPQRMHPHHQPKLP